MIDKDTGFTPGSYIMFIGQTGPRWTHGDSYYYSAYGYVQDKNGDISKPSWPTNYLRDNFICIQQQRDKLINILLDVS